MDHGGWPRLSDIPYTAEEVVQFTEYVLNTAGQVVELNPEGNFYSLDMMALAPYAKIHSDSSVFVLQNPVGRIFVLEG